MNGLKTSALCLLAGLGTNVQAASPAEIRIELSQLISLQCSGALKNTGTILPGDCITYRITVENIGQQTAHQVQVSALIPEHTELQNTLRNVTTNQRIETVVERKADGTRVIKAALTSVPVGRPEQVVLEYSVRVL